MKFNFEQKHNYESVFLFLVRHKRKRRKNENEGRGWIGEKKEEGAE